MSFDFQRYLANIDPGQKYEVTAISAAFVNQVARAVRTSTTDGLFETRSLILKHATPYVEGYGQDAPLTQFRQVIEARALTLLAALLPCGHDVKVPRLLKHDPDSHVVIMTDLDNLPNLSEVFSVLGEHRSTERHRILHPDPRLAGSGALAHYSAIGTKLGHFFALLHSPQIVEAIESSPDFGPQYLSNPQGDAAVLIMSVKVVQERLRFFPDLIERSEADRLYTLIEEDAVRPLSKVERSLALGDCWTSAILVQPDITTKSPVVGVVDWEFASIGRGVHGDLAQLIAYLELFRIAAVHQALDQYVAVIDALTQSMTTAYKTQCPVHSSAPTPLTSSNDMLPQMLRSAFFSQAGEMVNGAFWTGWPCKDPTCVVEDGSHTPVKQDCVLIKKMIARAIWYVNHARNTPDEFFNEPNWRILMDEKKMTGGWGLLGLLPDSWK